MNLFKKRVNELNKRSEEKTKQVAADIISEYERKAKLTEEERITEIQKRRAKKSKNVKSDCHYLIKRSRQKA